MAESMQLYLWNFKYMSLYHMTRTKCTSATCLHLPCLKRVQNFSVPLQCGKELPQSCGTPLGLAAGTCFTLDMTEFGLVFMGCLGLLVLHVHLFLLLALFCFLYTRDQWEVRMKSWECFRSTFPSHSPATDSKYWTFLLYFPEVSIKRCLHKRSFMGCITQKCYPKNVVIITGWAFKDNSELLFPFPLKHKYIWVWVLFTSYFT